MATKKTTQKPSLSSRTQKAILALPPAKQKYVAARLKGKSKKDAAVEAGYSASTSRVATSHVEDEQTANVLAMAMREAIPVVKLVQRVAEGLDAEKTEFAKFEGQITDSKNCVDFEQRRKYVELAAELMGHREPGGGSPVFNNNGPTQFVIDL